MGFIKCPRCELNYIREEEQYCPVCKREMKGESHDDPFELCSICNENPVMPGKDVCYACYKEMNQHQSGRRMGTGIGLSIVSTILNAHGMKYGVDSDEKETVFWFEVTKADVPQES